MNTHSNLEDYKSDSPAGYTVPLEMKDATLVSGVGIRPLGTSTIGDPDADEIGDLKNMIDANSDSDQWKEDAPAGYKKNVGFDANV